MSLLGGIDRAPSPPTFEQLRRGIERLGAELVPGMYLLSGGYWAVVAEGDITTDNLGRMSVAEVAR